MIAINISQKLNLILKSKINLKFVLLLTLYWQNAGFKVKLNYFSNLYAVAFHIVFLLKLDNLKKHRLRSV